MMSHQLLVIFQMDGKVLDQLLVIIHQILLDIGDAPFSFGQVLIQMGPLSGSPELDNLSVNVTKTGSSGTEDGWNLISNPYPVPLLGMLRARNSTISTTVYAYSLHPI